jgi:hypothetical protein
LGYTEQAIDRQGQINVLAKEELGIKQQTTREASLGARGEELLKEIMQSKGVLSDNLLAKIQLITNATTNTGAATKEWSAQLTRADGSMATIGNTAQNTANQTGQIYMELQKSTGEIQIFGGAMDGAKFKVGETSAGVFTLNSALAEAGNLGGAVGAAFTKIAEEARKAAEAANQTKAALVEAIAKAIELERQQFQSQMQAADRSVKQNAANDLAQGLDANEATLFKLQAEKQRLSGEIGGSIGQGFNIAGKFYELDKAIEIFTTAVQTGGRNLEQLANQYLSGGSVVADREAALERARTNLTGKLRPGKLGGGLNDLNQTTGMFSGFATGGFVMGKGTATSDSIPAMLSNGEYVINAQATAKFKPILDAINSGIKLPKFADGGIVQSQSFIPDNAQNSIAIPMPEIKIEAPKQTPIPAIRQEIYSELENQTSRLGETYSELGRGTERITANLGNFSSSLNTVTRTISESIPTISSIRTIQPSQINPPRASNFKAPGAIAAQAMPAAGNTINIVNRPEPELDIRNALIQLGRVR